MSPVGGLVKRLLCCGLAGLAIGAGGPAPAGAGTGADSGPAWAGGFDATQVWTANVFGTEPSPSDNILDTRGWAAWFPAASLRLRAAGRLVRFYGDPLLDHGYASGSLEWQGASGLRQRFLAGASGSWRINGDLYAPYDHRQLALYAETKRYFTPAFTGQLRADFAARRYPDLPEEDARKAQLAVRLNRSLATRTSLGLTLGAGWKLYREDLPDSIAGGADGSRRAARWEVACRVAQSLSERLAARAWWERSRLTESVDAAALLAGFENPLLDEFSAEGDRIGAALKAILPRNWVAEVSGEHARLDYPGRPPALYDPAADEFVLDEQGWVVLGAGERRDTVNRLGLDLRRQLNLGGGGARLVLGAGVEWVDQDSNDLYYGWSGWAGNAGASVAF